MKLQLSQEAPQRCLSGASPRSARGLRLSTPVRKTAVEPTSCAHDTAVLVKVNRNLKYCAF